MTEQEAKRNVKLYKWFVLLKEPLFWGPTLFLFIQNVGKMDLASLLLMEAVVTVITGILVEIPSGTFADIVGRKITLLIASTLMSVSIVWFSLVDSPLDVWIANIFCMTALAIFSGADSSLLCESLKKLGKENEFKKIKGGAISNKFLFLAFCTLPMGMLSTINPRIPFLISIPGVIASCILVLYFKESSHRKKLTFKKNCNLVKSSLIFVKNNRKVTWFICFSVLILVSSKLWFFSYKDYFELTGVHEGSYGFIYSFLNIIAWFFSKHAYNLEKKIGGRHCITGLIMLIGMPILFMGTFVSKLMISMIFLQNIVRGFIDPFTDGFFNQNLTDEKRATVLSINSASIRLVGVIAQLLYSGAITNWHLPASLQILGITVLIIGIFLIISYRKIFR